MRIRWLIACLICIALTVALAGAAAMAATYKEADASLYKKPASLSQIQSTVDLLYDAASSSNRQMAYRAVQQLSSQLRNGAALQGYAGTQAGWKQMERESQSLQSMLESGDTIAQWRPEAVSLKLAVDAAVSSAAGLPHKALWMQYRPLITEDIARVRAAVDKQDEKSYTAARAALDLLVMHVERIAGAAAMTDKEAEMKQLRSIVNYSVRLLEAGGKGELSKLLSGNIIVPLEQATSTLFQSDVEAEEPVLAPVGGGIPHRWIFGLSSLITSLLAFVSWRKYKHSPYAILSGNKERSNPLVLKRKP